MSIPPEVIDQLHDRLDIIEVIQGYVPLKKAGRNYLGLCPFHQESTPSFTVTPEKQLFYCFGCGKGGNVFTFVMQHDKLEFPDAVRNLAERVGIAIPERAAAGPADELATLQRLAADYFRQALAGSRGAEARAYLKRRGITEETVKIFGLGYAPAQWQGLIDHAAGRQVTAQRLSRAGLAIAKADGRGFYDRFRHRLIFPIHDGRARVVGFGGRTLQAEDQPKYMNSPETELFSKGRLLFGFSLAKEAAATAERIVVVEGYVDAVVAHQAGCRETVSAMGTALTADHARLLKRYVKTVVMVFDADQAGELATLRGLDLLIAHGLQVRLVRLPAKTDPDEFILQHGAPRWRQLLDGAQDLLEYKLQYLTTKHDAKQLQGRVAICEEMLSSLRRVENAIARSEYLKRLAEALSVDEAALAAELKKLMTGRAAPSAASRATAAPAEGLSVVQQTERMIAGLLLTLEDPALVQTVRGGLPLERLQDASVRRVLSVVYRDAALGQALSASRLMTRLDAPELMSLVMEWLATVEPLPEKRLELEGCLKRMERMERELTLRQLHGRIRQAETQRNEPELQALMKTFHTVRKGG